MLIKCPECGKEISDKSEQCIQCGFPLKKNNKSNNNICKIDGVERNLEEQMQNINNGQYKPLKKFVNEYGMSLKDASTLWSIIESTNQIPPEYNSEIGNQYRTEERQKIEQSKPKCPHCNSTNISHIGTGERAASIIGLGIFSKKINKSFKCKSCGYTW